MAYGRMSSTGFHRTAPDFETSGYVQQYGYGRSNFGGSDFGDCSSSRSGWSDCCGCPPSKPSSDELIARKIESALDRILSKYDRILSNYTEKFASADNLKLNAAPAEMRSPSLTKQDGTGPAETKLGFGLNDNAGAPGSANEAMTTVGVAPATEDAHSFG